MTLSNRYRFTLYGLVLLLTGMGLLFAVVRFLVNHPEMLEAISFLGVFVLILLSPGMVSRVKSPSTRVLMGCFVLPLVFIFLGSVFSVMIVWLRYLSLG